MIATAEQIEAQLAALRRERAGYIARGLDDRVRDVDEQIARLGGAPTDAARRGALTRLRRAAGTQER